MTLCRAYKLGKKRWSYNQCELLLFEDQTARNQDALPLNVIEATCIKQHEAHAETCVSTSAATYFVLLNQPPGSLPVQVFDSGTATELMSVYS